MTFRIGRIWVNLLRFSGLVLVPLGILTLARPFLDPSRPVAFVLVVGSLILALGSRAIYVGFRSERYSVELSREGIRMPARDLWLPWSQIREIRERPLLQRVDLLDQSGSRAASLEYQLDGFDEALRRTVSALSMTYPAQDTFTSGLLTLFMTDDGVSIQGGLARDQFIPWSGIAAVQLGLVSLGRGNRGLAVLLIDRAGNRRELRRARVDPFHLAARIEQRLNARAKA